MVSHDFLSKKKKKEVKPIKTSSVKVTLDLTGIEMTNVPNEEDLNTDPNYYVYEWYIKDSGEIFYIGKGKGKRVSNKRKNYFFNQIVNNFDCAYRIVKEELTEYEALVHEEKLMQKRYKEGYILANIQVVNAPSVSDEPIIKYMTTPKVYSSLVDKHYFDIQDMTFDEIDINKLKFAHFPNHAMHSETEGLYLKNYDDLNTEQNENEIKKIIEKAKSKIENSGGRVYKTKAKSVKSLIYFNPISYYNYKIVKEDGYDVYHLIDVLNFLETFKGKL